MAHGATRGVASGVWNSAQLWRIGRMAVIGAVAGATLAGCAATVNPATGQRQYTTLSTEDEQRLGAQEHPKVLKQFGGVYDDPNIGGYVAEIGGRIAANSELPNQRWTFTVLDSPIVNAFALPGGYIYISRGLMALANSEAELAGVLGHEIGHVTARHTAQRVTRSQVAGVGGVLAQIGAAALGVDPRAVGQLTQVASKGWLAQFSQGQELEADRLGVRYISRGGYDPMAQADFLASMQSQSQLQSQLRGGSYDPNRVDFFATHPATARRVQEAVAAARASGLVVNENAPRNANAYLRALDGMIYGDSPEKGFVKGNVFAHPELRFQFAFPRGYQITNTDQAVGARGNQNQQIVFDAGQPTGESMDRYIANTWAPQVARQARAGRLQGLERITVNGLPAATAALPVDSNKGRLEARLVAIDASSRIYRFLALYPASLSQQMSEPLRRMTYSFRTLSASEAAALTPNRIRVVTVRSGDTVSRLARRMTAFEDNREARFRVLNGLGRGDQLRAGQLVKVVVD